MAYKARPKPSFLDTQEYLGFKHGEKLWRSLNKERYYTWDGRHGDIEVFNKIGLHLGSLDAITGEKIKDAVRGRKIDVN